MSEESNERTNAMNRLITSKRFLTAAAAIAVVAGAGGALAASSSSSSPSFLDRVAQHLGISTEKLQDATKAAALDQVDADLKAGRITKAQADELKKRIEAGDFPPFGLPPFGGRGFFEGPGFGFGFGRHVELLHPLHQQAVADYLGLTVAQLREKLQNGDSLAEIAKAQDKSVDGLKDVILAEAKKHLDKAVSAGKLTQAQADEMFEHISEDVGDIVNGTFPRLRHLRGMKPLEPSLDKQMWRMPPVA
jgi:Protein of unknown function (DUF2680)